MEVKKKWEGKLSLDIKRKQRIKEKSEKRDNEGLMIRNFDGGV